MILLDSGSCVTRSSLHQSCSKLCQGDNCLWGDECSLVAVPLHMLVFVEPAASGWLCHACACSALVSASSALEGQFQSQSANLNKLQPLAPSVSYNQGLGGRREGREYAQT
jgi:hypothetical protein